MAFDRRIFVGEVQIGRATWRIPYTFTSPPPYTARLCYRRDGRELEALQVPEFNGTGAPGALVFAMERLSLQALPTNAMVAVQEAVTAVVEPFASVTVRCVVTAVS
ncbi:hypothetical protein ACN27J_26185 [Solwaraspora sp. WMMB762]|uniref:hypothetical protein n=1 Tax=Solwaraspora sp. WMMB762 TaxID=3404120 RepID=UPI003B93EAC5